HRGGREHAAWTFVLAPAGTGRGGGAEYQLAGRSRPPARCGDAGDIVAWRQGLPRDAAQGRSVGGPDPPRAHHTARPWRRNPPEQPHRRTDDRSRPDHRATRTRRTDRTEA